jgi:hypothetical protein
MEPLPIGLTVQEAVQQAVFHSTAQDPTWIGYYLARHLQLHAIGQGEQALLLGIDLDGLTRLAVCRSSRRSEDLEVICSAIGANPVALRRLLEETED